MVIQTIQQEIKEVARELTPLEKRANIKRWVCREAVDSTNKIKKEVIKKKTREAKQRLLQYLRRWL